MLRSIGVGKEVTGIARQAMGAQTAQRWAQFAQQLNPARVALRVDVAVDVVCINNRMDPLELVNHLVDATREQRQLNVVDEQRRGFIDKRARVLAAQISGVSMARRAVHGDGVVLVHCHAVIVDNLMPLGH